MRLKKLAAGVALAIVAATLSPNASAAIKAGSPCTKLGLKSVSGGKSYTCVKSGKKLLWNKGVLSPIAKPAPSATAIPVPTKSPEAVSEPSAKPSVPNTNVVTEATKYIQNLINQTSTQNSENSSKVVMHVEPGKNGIYPEIAEKALLFSLDFYAALGMKLPQPTVHLILGRTQDWLREQANLYAPGCINSNYKFNGSASLCANPQRSAIYSHMPTAVTMASAAPNDIDLTNLAEVFRYTNQAVLNTYDGMSPHEAHHAWQDGSYGGAGQDMPKWLWEGGASLFSEMSIAKMRDPEQTYLRFEPGLVTGWGKKDCFGPAENMKPVCEYTQGIIVMEYFLYKFGIPSYIKLITQSKSPKFSENFRNATGMDLPVFYQEVNQYLRIKGWN